MEDESYISDLPFNTEEIALVSPFPLEDEAYINDIPFNTYNIAMCVNMNDRDILFATGL